MLEIRKDTQGSFCKPTSIIRHRYALEECVGSGCVVVFIVQWLLPSVDKCMSVNR